MEPRSNMPRFEFLTRRPLDTSLLRRKLEVLRALGHPYSDAEIEGAQASVDAQAARIAADVRKDGVVLGDAAVKSEAIALIAYLQRLGTDLGWRAGAGAAAQGGR
jgi:cytochrome c oxidase cbb3-type subunit I/II